MWRLSGLVLSALAAVASGGPPATTSPRGVRVVVFLEPGFPSVDVEAVAEPRLLEALAGRDVVVAGRADLARALAAKGNAGVTVFLNPYGSAFPKDAWPAIRDFLVAGGSWVNLGGVPFAVPVVRDGDGWRQEVRQTAYHKELGINQAFPVSADLLKSYAAVDTLPGVASLPGAFRARSVFELYVRFTSTNDSPGEDGSSGTRDAVLTPLVHGLSSEGRPLAAPLVRIDRMNGPCSGGRWVLAPVAGSVAPASIGALVDLAAEGAMAVAVRTTYASYQPGERASFSVQLRRPGAPPDESAREEARVEIADEAGRVLGQWTVPLRGPARLAESDAMVVQGDAMPRTPGLYTIRARVSLAPRGAGAGPYEIAHTNGFWIFDAELLARGPRLTAGRYHLLRNGEPFPIAGTSHMASDVQRRFLFEPNPAVWDRDFAAMQKDGVNLVRTGLWTGWRRVLLDAGVPDETSLRALDAFMLTARRHEVPVIFTFFAFFPESWGAANPYLDPRARAAQRELLATIARRYRTMNDLAWDLINEPSFSSPRQPWSVRPNYDAYEVAAWRDWLRREHPAGSDAERAARLQELWRATPDDALGLPALDEFRDRWIFGRGTPLRVLAYRLFAQEAFEGWMDDMKSALRSAGNPAQLVTMGQDEGGETERPGPLFHGRSLDFTCAHTWWNNDDLLWDQVLAGFTGRPRLVEETGVMFYEGPDGNAWRTEDQVRDLLARKLALSADGAGAIEWLWQTNDYMFNDNEAGIGMRRPDGTEKPEIESFRAFASFLGRSREHFRGREDEDVVMVVPHSLQLSTRDLATSATRRAVRLMAYRCRTPLRAVSEYRVAEALGRPKLVVLPSPRVLNQKAWQALLAAVEAGATLLVTGPIDADEYYRPEPRLRAFGLEPGRKPVAPSETIDVEGVAYPLSYRGDKQQAVEKADVGDSRTRVFRHGKGSIVWSPLPVELAEETEAGAALYRFALKQAGRQPGASAVTADESVLIRPTVFADAVLYTLVSEGARDADVVWTREETRTRLSVKVPAGRAVLLWVDRKTGRILDRATL